MHFALSLRSVTFGLGMLIMLCSCKAPSKVVSNFRTDSGYCYPGVVYMYDSALTPMDSSAVEKYAPVTKNYSRHSIMIANAAGVLAILKATDNPVLPPLVRQEKENQILTRLMLMTTELESTAAELDCEGERADQMAGFLEQNENQRVKRLTIVSIALGAAGGIGNAVLKTHPAAVASAVIGGSLSAGLGFSALMSGKKVEFDHSRNLLSDIWNQPKRSSVYPPALWYIFSEKYFSNSRTISIADNMKHRWMTFEGLDNKRQGLRRQNLLFGTGGSYSSDDLRARARMLNQVQAAVKLMNQDLQGLVEEIIRNSKSEGN